ncbi:MAG: hypothetical protein AAF447_26220, partial [Myxococcota bacterium]
MSGGPGDVARRLAAGAPEEALAHWRRTRGDLRLAFDRDPPFTGARVARPALAWSSLEGRLRSWEMLDRVTGPAPDQDAEDAATRALELLGCPGVLRRALLLRLNDAGHATLLGRADGRWSCPRSKHKQKARQVSAGLCYQSS